MIYAKKNKLNMNDIEALLIEVDRLKSSGNLSDGEILVKSLRNVVMKRREY